MIKHSLDADFLRDSMRGQWRDYFESNGIELPNTNSKHGPCPHCDGKDRFRFDDKNGSGSYICSQCGAGDGFSLLMKVTGYSFPDALKAVASYLGIAESQGEKIQPKKHTKPENPVFDKRKADKINQVFAGADRIGWPLAKYFKNRGLGALSGKVPSSLRYHSALPYWEETSPDNWKKIDVYPAMLGSVTNLNNDLIALHRTFLTPEGNKAPVPQQKKLMSPAIPGSTVGCSIKLGKPTDTLYLTEGIETALAVMLSTGEPVWACVSAKLLEQVQIPTSVSQVYIMADKDKSKTGEISANKLAQRLLKKREGIKVKVCLPDLDIPADAKSVDWLDFYNLEESAA